jgi:predicted nucleic acid-binding protein
MVASNSSPLIWLSQTGHFDLLKEVFGTVAITPEVRAETVDRAAGYPNAANVTAAIGAGWMKVIAPVDTGKVAVLKAQLHAGEAETLVMGQEQKVDVVLVDDLQARHFATAMGLKIVGTAGILLLACDRGIKLDVKTVLDSMRGSGFRLGESVYQDILKRVGQEAR